MELGCSSSDIEIGQLVQYFPLFDYFLSESEPHLAIDETFIVVCGSSIGALFFDGWLVFVGVAQSEPYDLRGLAFQVVR